MKAALLALALALSGCATMNDADKARAAVVADVASSQAVLNAAMVTLGVWMDGEERREFMRECARHRLLTGNPALTCNYRRAA